MNLNNLKLEFVRAVKLLIRIGLIVINDGFICLPVKKDLIIFESFNGKDISDNPAAIYRQLIRDYPSKANNLYFGIKPSQYRKIHQKYPNIKLLKRFMPKWIWYTARANFWIFNSRMPIWWHKNKKTIYIQTWHGTPLKKLGLDIQNVSIPGTTTKKYKRNFAKESSRWDTLIAPNLYSEKIFKRAFAFKNHFIRSGYPRNDVLYQDNVGDKIKSLKQRLVGDANATIITYAPTWRDDDYRSKGSYRFELPFDLNQFFKHVDRNTKLIIRPHYLIKDRINIKGFEKRVKILSEGDINQIYLASDMLITDYSSVMFDYANLKRPMLFYAYDLEHYDDQLRGFYFNYKKDVPGPLVTKADDLYHQLDIFTNDGGFKNYQTKLDRFHQKYCSWEHINSSEAIVRLLKENGYGRE
ncbi:CDP-glycerol glycerophosphotransferase [Philodulcilactobacillus myokoensis]|uniref:CDP-glycerol glycerophosphotransferase n=1 Tax=Philodulcilactobacillus myokoensis TaxID=2929573 RepID=A0A9W6B141_9LACO|nr:CDP-glycerol glycerophosphotransferase family protein [Philodulcilactobacillus myokoensis]GLB46917.1 CDP-glycerol glycerophosphotransferase [Philodulcilactobacillus myokoensis]